MFGDRVFKLYRQVLQRGRLMRPLFIVLVLASALPAQIETTTSIRGIVTDSSGGSISGASVIVRNTETNEERTATTDVTGFYAFPSLPPGTFAVTVSHPGFKRGVVSNRVAQVGESAQVDFSLQVGAVSESVTVSAEGAELLTTTSAEVAGVINNQLVENLPLNGRNFYDMAAVLPHVSMQSLGNQLSQASRSMNLTMGLSQSSPMFRSSGIFAAGNRDSATNTSIDGLNVQSSIFGQTTPQSPPSSIQEMKVHVSGMNAEFGNGVAAVNIITKNGTNRFHGDLYEYLRNSATDANNFFNNLNARNKPPYRQNQFGAAAGGPVLRDKLFFFASYEGLRVRQATLDVSVTPPPPELRSGDFSSFHPRGPQNTTLPVPTIYNPFQFDPRTGLRTPFPGNKIPVSAMDPVTLKFLQDWVEQPNSVGNGAARYLGNARQALDEDQGLIRIDYVRNANTRVYGRTTRAVTPSINTAVESLTGTNQNASDFNAVAHWTQIVSASTVSDVMIGFARPNWLGGRDIGVPDVDSAIGLGNSDKLGGGPFFNTGYSMNGLNGGPYMGGPDNLFQAGGDLTHIRGRHSLKFGVQAMERRLYWLTHGNDKGSFVFSPTTTSACPDGNNGCTAARNAAGLDAGGNAFASYLLGVPTNITFALNEAPFHGQRRYYGAYAQDSWRASGRLTVNYGVRYELFRPWFLPRHTMATFDRTTGNLEYVLRNPLDYLDPGKGYGRSAPLNSNLPETGYRQSTLNFAPRTGLAWSLASKSVFRAGYGIYFDANELTSALSNIASSVGPFRLQYNAVASTNEQVPSLRVNGNFPFPNPTAIPAPNATPLATFSYLERYYPLPSVQEWSASLQQGIGHDWTAEIAYQGTHAVHLTQNVDVNAPALPQGALANVAINQRRKFPQWGVIQTYLPIGYSRYEGVSGTVRNVQWRGLTLISAMTFAKNLSSFNLGGQSQGNQHVDYAYIWRGPAHLTPRLRFTNSWSYRVPFGRGAKGVVKALGDGWTLSGIVDMSTGIPNFVTTTDSSGTGYGIMPNRICDARDVPGGRTRQEWFNTACFAQPAFGTFGNSNFGVYEDPGTNNWNVTVSKTIKIGAPLEEGRLQIRTDFFNAWNHTQWGSAVNSTLQSGNVNAGQIQGTRPARHIQFSLHYMF